MTEIYEDKLTQLIENDVPIDKIKQIIETLNHKSDALGIDIAAMLLYKGTAANHTAANYVCPQNDCKLHHEHTMG
eukprot:4582524-Amphidinium_carterae.1